jgi:ankyrin repeat protein
MAKSDKTPYQILDVSKNISYGDLRTVYRTKIHEHLQNKISVVDFRHICRAYETLSDFNKRGRYNSHKEWTSELPLNRYTPQQLAAEPDLIRDLKQRLSNATLTEINARDRITGHTPLYCAARAGNIEAVKFLTEHGAEPDLSQRTKSTALHVAAFYGHTDVVGCLLESGADYRIMNSMNHTAEQEAFNDDVIQIFAELKQHAYVRVAANELDWFYENGLTQHQDTDYFAQCQTLLHCASKKGYFDMVCWLVEQRSANLDLDDSNRNSALHLAAYYGHADIINYLLNRGCNPTLKNRWGTTAEEEGSKHGTNITDLFKSMRERDLFEMARKGVDWWFYYYFDDRLKDMIDSKGISLLYYACRYGHYFVAKWLLEHGANINIQMIGKPRSTPLHGAKYYGHLSVVELLLEYGADFNIKNDFGATVFDDGVSNEVDKNLSSKIEDVLLKYQRYLKTHKLIDVYIYLAESKEEEPVIKLQIDHTTVYQDLLQALPKNLWDVKYYFSIAGRPLDFNNSDKRLMSAVYCARYGTSKLLDTPLRLTLHQTPLNNAGDYFTRENPQLEHRQVASIFGNEKKSNSFLLKFPFTNKKTFNSGDLTFTFSANCVKNDVTFEVQILHPSDVREHGLPDAICFFKTSLSNAQSSDALLVLPLVSITRQPNARLYTMAMPSSYWFSSDMRPNQLPMLGGIHAFIRHIDIIPNHLTLPLDMFIAAAHGQPLRSRSDPVPCTCLLLREQNTHTFPNRAYHGTNINAVRSILIDGLVVPGTVTSSGKRINPPPNHIARDVKALDMPDFAAAIFLSPSIHYSSHRAYAIPFSNGNQQLIPVLECSVKHGSYDTARSTVREYVTHPGDDPTTIEWRVKDPANVEINAVLFITTIDSIAESKTARLGTNTSSSNQCIIA